MKTDKKNKLSKANIDFKNLVLAEYEKGNIIVATFEGLKKMSLDEFVKQPAEGMLYDLNRDEGTVLTFIDNKKWINDFAVAKVIQKLKSMIDKRNAIIEILEEYINTWSTDEKIGLRQKIEQLKSEI